MKKVETNDELFAAFNKFEMQGNQQTIVVAGAAGNPPGTNCDSDPTSPTTSSGGETTTDQDWICDDSHAVAVRG